MRTKEETEQLLAEGRAVVQVSADERPRFAGSRVDCDRLLYAVGRVVAADFQCLDHIRELVGAENTPSQRRAFFDYFFYFPGGPTLQAGDRVCGFCVRNREDRLRYMNERRGFGAEPASVAEDEKVENAHGGLPREGEITNEMTAAGAAVIETRFSWDDERVANVEGLAAEVFAAMTAARRCERS